MKYFVMLCCLSIALGLSDCNRSSNRPVEPVTPTPSLCTPLATKTLSVTLRPQETGMWCWAASGEMCMDFLGTDVNQCDQANKRFSRTDCCNSPTPNECIQGGWPDFVYYGFTFVRTTDAPLSWPQIREQIFCKKKPFAFTWHWTKGGGHMMVVRGYKTEGGTNYVYVNNPGPPNVGTVSYKTYSEYVSGTNHTHWDDFYDITKK